MKYYRKYIFIFLGLVYFICSQPSALYGQEVNITHIDSVLAIIKTQNVKEQGITYEDLGIQIIRNHSPGDATSLFRYALEKDTTDLAKLWLYDPLSKNLSRNGLLDDAIELKKQGILLSEKLQNERTFIFYNISLANSYLVKNTPDDALRHLNIAEPMAEKDVNRDLLSKIYYNKGMVFGNLDDIDKAEAFYLKMWDAEKNNENNPGKRFAAYVLVDFYAQIDKPIQLTKFTETLSLLYIDANPDTPLGHMPIKHIFANKLDPENIPRYKEAVRISDSMQSYNSYLHTTFALANVYNAIGEPEKGIPYLKNAEQTFLELGKPSQLQDIYTVLTQTNAQAKNYKEAYTYKVLQASLKDSITSEKMQRNIAALEIKFDTEKKEHEIAEQKLIIEKKNKERSRILYGLIGLGVLSVLLFVFFRYRLKSQKTIANQTEAIQQQKITELQQTNKLLAMSSMIEGQEAERLRIAKDLHDSLGGLLSTVKAHFTTIQHEIVQLEEFNLTAKTNTLIDEACTEVRRISHNMMPQALSISGLKGAVEDLANQLSEQGFETTIEISKLPEGMDSTREVMIYRLLQEVISNIRKHAKASTVLIQLIGHDDDLTIIVEDNGQGFNYEEQVANGGLGLKSINSRVQFLDGTINWDTQLGNGTVLNVTIPVK